MEKKIITKEIIADGKFNKLSLNALSEATGIDKKTIKKRLIEAGLYPPDQYPPQKVIEAINPQTIENLTRLEKFKLAILRENWRKLKIANDRQEGLLIEKSKVYEQTSYMAEKIKNLLENKLVNEYPTIVAGLDVPDIRIYGRKLFEEICYEIQSWSDDWKI